MYDNLDLVLSSNVCSGTDLIAETPNYLTKITSQGTSDFGHYVNGYLGNLKVKISDNGVKVYDSSICKYYLGDNFKTLSRGDVKRAVENISDSLHLPIHLANVTRIDVAQNLIMQYPEKLYYNSLGEAQYYNRLPQNNGLYYNNDKRQLLFYGKEHEQKIKGQNIPKLYKNRNVLRFELRFKKRLKEQFNISVLNTETLFNESFYYDLVRRWKNEYQAIQKINNKLGNMTPTGSKKELIENLALHTILELGQSNILAIVGEWQGKGNITKKQAYDLRNSIKTLSKIPRVEGGNDLIEELNKKIGEAARYS